MGAVIIACVGCGGGGGGGSAVNGSTTSSLGVLYIAGHGGDVVYTLLPPSRPNPPPKNITGVDLGFGLWMSTPWDTTTAAAYQVDYANHSLGLMLAQVDSDANGKPLFAWHYAITSMFIKTCGWSFSNDSLVVIGGCDGGTTGAQPFRDAFYAAGASVILAWPYSTSTEGTETTYLFDRMLDIYSIAPVPPSPLRALSIQDALLALSGGTYPLPADTYPNPNASNVFTAFLPTISSATVSGATSHP